MTETQRLQKHIALTQRRIGRSHGQYQRAELFDRLTSLRNQLAFVQAQADEDAS